MATPFQQIAVAHWSRDRKLTWLASSPDVTASPAACDLMSDVELTDEVLRAMDRRQARLVAAAAQRAADRLVRTGCRRYSGTGWCCSLPEHDVDRPHVALTSDDRPCAVWFEDGIVYECTPADYQRPQGVTA